METKKSMDPKQIAMLCTENQQIYMSERARGDFFENDNDPDKKGVGPSKEPQIPLCAKGTYPLKYLMEFFKLAKQSKANHITFEMAKENRPLRMEFLSGDALNLERGSPKLEKTWLWVAPRVSSDDESIITKEEIESKISAYENEIKLLRERLS